MKATIHDRTALSTVELSDLNIYLERHGWHRYSQPQNNSAIWIYDEGSNESEILIPVNHTTEDYLTRISQSLKSLELIENRSQIDILRDITLVGVDIIKVRAPEVDSKRTSTHFRSGVEILDNALEMMASAASAAVSPRRVLPTRRATQVDEYLKWLELGQAEKGSYVITILSRVETMLRASIPPLIEMLETPFPRVVTRTLSNALNSAKNAVISPSSNYQSFVENVPSGISANLCESIAGMLKNTPQIETIDLNISWAMKLPEPNLPDNFTFNKSDADVLFEAAKVLRAESPTEGLLITGVVVNLHRETGATDGITTIACVIGGNVRKLSVPLQSSEYDLAIQAHRDKRALLFKADITHSGRQYQAINVHDFRIID